jgi:conjugative transfer region protein (TIGR03750 family)
MTDQHTIAFVPTRLNKAPIVFRGMTGREVGLVSIGSLLLGVLPGLIGWWAVGMIAMVPTVMAIVAGTAIWFGGTMMRRLRRGRPETWLYRRMQCASASRGGCRRQR